MEAEYNKLSKTIFSHRRAGLLHGKLPVEEKLKWMQKFADGELRALVSTTVVEVGVNVCRMRHDVDWKCGQFRIEPSYQLRGRVKGVSELCHLMMSGHDSLSQRLREIEKSQDGFIVRLI